MVASTPAVPGTSMEPPLKHTTSSSIAQVILLWTIQVQLIVWIFLNITENSVTFLVKTSGDHRSFFIRYEELDEESYEQIRKGDKAVVKGLVPSGKYQFKFQIDPPWRIRRDVKPLQITLLPAVPEVIFRSVRDNQVEIEIYRSTDDIKRKTIDEHELTYNIVQMHSSRINDCVINIKIPVTCSTSRYTIAGLSTGFYYEIRVRAHTKDWLWKYVSTQN
ncbi:uncharacterized protein CEXT_563481 [Caerostris extrusa]|uniref:Fibronectin type-III domain-containing protein n=1 Tax=Caerostris extrusa TaxID=172846 RepID=A0AAV4MNW8_CAEEX|nr:uncharacterized protein CEXT_563481 [Caerostris extrusa]